MANINKERVLSWFDVSARFNMLVKAYATQIDKKFKFKTN